MIEWGVPMKRAFLGGLAVLALGLAAAVYWLFYENNPPSDGKFPLDIAALRDAASSLPGPGPIRIEVETIYRSEVPRIALITGTDWGDLKFVRNSYRIAYADYSIILDTANDEATARDDTWTVSYDVSAWARMQSAMSQADMIIVTHEHCDHIGGLLQSPNWKSLLSKAILNQAQFENQPECTVWPEGSRESFEPLQYDGLHAVAPGVVLIEASGHTLGSQMVYVRQEDGREFLFSGDTASSLDNVALLRPRSRYVMITGGHEDNRDTVFLQTIAIKRMMDEVPDLILVPGHDEVAIKTLEEEGLLKRGFSVP